MNKKKEKKLLEKKQQEVRRQAILGQLAANQLSAEQMKSMNSIKDATSGANKKIKNQKAEVVVQQPEEQVVQQISVNIFETNTYENPTPVEIIHHEPQNMKISESDRLEIEAKQLFPELTLDTFDLKRRAAVELEQYEYDPEKDDIYDIDPQLLLSYDTLITDVHKFKSIQLVRDEKMHEQRRQLPILAQESDIIDSIKGNLITLISGETGCGKSTQIPQFLYEAGFTEFGAIAITQPRRLAAIALAQRVAEETGFTLGNEIAYQVKHQSSGINDKMKMKFLTDGILIKEMQTSALLPQYSVIIVDEAHERKVNIDILIGVLSRIVIARAKIQKPLRLVIMSATLRLDDFLNNKLVFPRTLNLIKVQTRQFPVQIFFSKITKDDYVSAVIEKCVKIHQTLPPGDVLVFLTGQREINECCSLLTDRLGDYERKESQEEDIESEEELKPAQDTDKAEYLQLKNTNAPKTSNTNFKISHDLKDFIVVPLYSKLEFKNQEIIFHNNPTKKRMIVIATNVAETSITIPTIRYVVDAGKQKRRITDPKIGLQKQVISWISQAAADQRSGRAGRTAPGYCYRLYSTAVYTKLSKFEEPEITQIGLDHTILQMKSIGIRDVYKFPYLTTPDLSQIKDSLSNLLQLGALKQSQVTQSDNALITQLGKVLSQIPLSPQFGKFLLQTRLRGMLHYGIILVCILSVDELLNRQSFDGEDIHTNQQKLKAFLNKYSDTYKVSDLFQIMNIVGSAITNITDDLEQAIVKAAQQHHLIIKSFKEVYYNVLQLLEIFNLIIEDKEVVKKCVSDIKQFQRPKREEQLILADLIIQTNGLQKVAKLQSKIDVEHNTRQYYYTTREHEFVYLHPLSIFHGKWTHEFLSYCSLFVDENSSGKVYMLNVTNVSNKSILYQMDTRTSLQKRLTVYEDSEYYDPVTDRMMCKGSAVVQQWTLEALEIPLPSDQMGFYSKFARALYKGEVIPFYGALQKYYKFKILDIRESNMQPYCQKILKSLMFNQITCKKDLITKWTKDKQFMLQELLDFVQEAYHQLIRSKWPPLEL